MHRPKLKMFDPYCSIIECTPENDTKNFLICSMVGLERMEEDQQRLWTQHQATLPSMNLEQL